jgi:hypothetical protein
MAYVGIFYSSHQESGPLPVRGWRQKKTNRARGFHRRTAIHIGCLSHCTSSISQSCVLRQRRYHCPTYRSDKSLYRLSAWCLPTSDVLRRELRFANAHSGPTPPRSKLGTRAVMQFGRQFACHEIKYLANAPNPTSQGFARQWSTKNRY